MTDHEKKQQTARENGKKSKGPVTPEGKARSAQNPITHGLASKCVVLANESQEKYDETLLHYQERWQPIDIVEDHLVLTMVNSFWRLRRIWAMDTAIFDVEMMTQSEDFDAEYSNTHPAMRAMDALAAISVENPVSLQNLDRYESRHERSYHKSISTLLKIRHGRNAPPTEIDIAAAFADPRSVAIDQPPTPVPPPPTPTPAPSWLAALLAFLIQFLGKFTKKPSKPTPEPVTRPAAPLSEPVKRSRAYQLLLTTFGVPEIFTWHTRYTPKQNTPIGK